MNQRKLIGKIHDDCKTNLLWGDHSNSVNTAAMERNLALTLQKIRSQCTSLRKAIDYPNRFHAYNQFGVSLGTEEQNWWCELMAGRLTWIISAYGGRFSVTDGSNVLIISSLFLFHRQKMLTLFTLPMFQGN